MDEPLKVFIAVLSLWLVARCVVDGKKRLIQIEELSLGGQKLCFLPICGVVAGHGEEDWVLVAEWTVSDEAFLGLFGHGSVLPDLVQHLSVLLGKETGTSSQQLMDDVFLLSLRLVAQGRVVILGLGRARV